MKKAMVLFAVLILICTAAAGGCADGVHFFENVWMTDSSLGESRAAILDKQGNLYLWDYSDDEPALLCQLPVYVISIGYYDAGPDELDAFESAVINIVDGEGMLYGINPFAGRIGTIDENGIAWTVSFDSSSLIKDNGWRYWYAAKLIRDGAMYLLINDDYEDQRKVLRIDLSTGETDLFDAPYAVNMCFQGEKLLLIVLPVNEIGDVTDDPSLVEMDPHTGEMRTLPQRLPAGTRWMSSMDATDDAVYVAAEASILISRDGEDFEVLQDSSPYIDKIRILPGGRMAIDEDSFYTMRLADAPADIKLSISGNGVDYKLRSAFSAQHPEALLQIDERSISAADVANRIRSGDTQTDIFVMQTDASFGALIEKGFTSPLEDDVRIADSAHRMYDTIRTALSDDEGHLVAYPISIWTSSWGYNEALWQKHFGDAPLPATYLELFTAFETFMQLDNDDGDLFFMEYDQARMVRYVLNAHIAAHGDEARFDDPLLLETLTQLERVQQILRERDMETWFEGDLYNDSEIVGVHSIFYMGSGYSSDTWRLSDWGRIPMSLDGEEHTVGRMTVLTVNPLSEHQELARAFIATATQADTGIVRYSMLHRDAQSVTQVNSRGEEETIVSTEALQKWAQATETLGFGERTVLLDEDMSASIETLCERYVSGQMPLQAMLSQLDAAANMIRQEK